MRRLIAHLLPLPAFVAIALILILSDDVWIARTLSRRAEPGSTFGAMALFAIAILWPLYYAAPLMTGWLGLARGVRTPSEVELKIGGFLLRALVLGTMYVVAYGLITRFG